MIRYQQVPGTKAKPERKAKPVSLAKKKAVKSKTRKASGKRPSPLDRG